MNTLTFTINSMNPHFTNTLHEQLNQAFQTMQDIDSFTSEVVIDNTITWAKVIDLNEERVKRDLPIILPFEEDEEE